MPREPQPKIILSPETPPEQEGEFDLERWLENEFSRQYDEQVQILNEAGLLTHFPGEDGEEDFVGILGIDGKKYPVPAKEEIANEFRREPEKYKLKMTKEGFTQFLLVPFASPLMSLFKALENKIVEHRQRGKLFKTRIFPDREDSEGADIAEPFKIESKLSGDDTDGIILYTPNDERDERQFNPKTKAELLAAQTRDPKAGWEPVLIEKAPLLFRLGIDARPPREFWYMLKNESRYKLERGITPEEWVIYFLTHLKQTNEVIDWTRPEAGDYCMLLGSYLGVHQASLLVKWVEGNLVLTGASMEGNIRTVVPIRE